MRLRYYSYTVQSAQDGMTVKTFLRCEKGLTAAVMTALKKTELGISRNGALLKAHDILHTGDRVEVNLPNEQSDIISVKGELDVLYEDERLLVVNKPPNMPVHPTRLHQLDTLANIVAYYQQNREESYVFRSLNRLDKDTSGCVIMAKDRIAHTRVFPTIQKRYLALCEGLLYENGTVDAPMGLLDTKMRRYVHAEGQRAVTHYEVFANSATHTLCELSLETGRTHQIRCHMSYLGCSLAGDDLYGGTKTLINRQALHCIELSFIHPDTGEHISCVAPLPTDFSSALSKANIAY